LDAIKRNPEAQEDWLTYHLIGDVLRQPDQAHSDISAAVRERLQAEPTVLAPRTQTRQQRARWFALSAAASVMAVGAVAWMSAQIAPETAPQLAAQQSLAARPASFPVEGNINDYLMAHQEMSPSASTQGAVPYVRTVVSMQPGR
jgi:sigma-E factor negative regulatory protein RseA